MKRKDIGEMALKFLDGLEAEGFDDDTEFSAAITIVHARHPNGKGGVLFLTSSKETHVNVGLLSEALRIEQHTNGATPSS